MSKHRLPDTIDLKSLANTDFQVLIARHGNKSCHHKLMVFADGTTATIFRVKIGGITSDFDTLIDAINHYNTAD